MHENHKMSNKTVACIFCVWCHDGRSLSSMSNVRDSIFKVRTLKSSIFNQSHSPEAPLLDVASYFDEFRELLLQCDKVRGKFHFESKKLETSFYAQLLDISSEQVEELNNVTSIDNLTCEGEMELLDHKLYESDADFHMKYEMSQLGKMENHNLASVKKRKEVQGDLYSHYNMKYGNYVWIADKGNPETKKDLNLFDFSNIVFCVKVYHPYLSYTGFNHRVKLLQEINVLGDQFLSDLKDKILCSMDYVGITDESDYPGLAKDAMEVKKREDYLSSFIFIENKFFNDTRSPELKDLSRLIIEWAKGKQLGNFTQGSMEKTQMKDLTLRMGYPYVYQHQGDCEHILIISDIRFLTVDDPLKRCNFPRVHARGRCTGKFCMMCGISYARWLVCGNSRLTHEKTYFCNHCFMCYNYIDGKKIGNFEAYKYIDPIAVL